MSFQHLSSPLSKVVQRATSRREFTRSRNEPRHERLAFAFNEPRLLDAELFDGCPYGVLSQDDLTELLGHRLD